MTENQLKAFLEKIKGDTGLKKKLHDAANDDTALVIAKEAGFTLTA